MMPFHDKIFLKICGRLLKGNISKPVNPAYFLEHTVNIYVCQTDPYYSNYNTFHIITILEVKKCNIPENYAEKPMAVKTTNYYLVFS